MGAVWIREGKQFYEGHTARWEWRRTSHMSRPTLVCCPPPTSAFSVLPWAYFPKAPGRAAARTTCCPSQPRPSKDIHSFAWTLSPSLPLKLHFHSSTCPPLPVSFPSPLIILYIGKIHLESIWFLAFLYWEIFQYWFGLLTCNWFVQIFCFFLIQSWCIFCL